MKTDKPVSEAKLWAVFFVVVATIGVCYPLVGCTSTESAKTIIYQPGSVTMNPLPYPVRAIETEAGDTEYVYVMPDGSHMNVSDMGVYGNFTLTSNQNDTIDAKAESTVESEIDATLTPAP